MKRIKNVILMITVAALCFSAFSCGPEKEVSGDLPENYVPNVAGTITITYQLATNDFQKDAVKKISSSFESAYPNTKVITDFGKGDTSLRISSGDIGDVFFLWEKDVYNYAVVNRAIMPLDSYVSAYGIDLSNVYTGVLDLGTVDGQLYMAARDYTHLVMAYNSDAVKAEGLEDPVAVEARDEWTWDTFKNYCQRLTKSENGLYTQVGAALRLNYAPVYIPFFEGWGGSWYDTVNKKITLTSDEKVLEGIEELVNVCQAGYVYARADAGENYTGAAGAAYAKISNGNDVAAYIFRDMEFPTMTNYGNVYNQQGIEWNIVSMPAFPTHKVGTGATGFSVYNRTKNPDTAAALCLYFLTEDGQYAYNSAEGGSVPNVRGLADNEFWKVPYDSETINYGAFTSYPEADTKGLVEVCVPSEIADIITKGMKTMLRDHLAGTRDFKDTLNEIETSANQKWLTLRG